MFRHIWLHDEHFLSHQTNMEMDERAIFPSHGGFSFEQFHPPDILWFTILRLIFQTCIYQGPGKKGGRLQVPPKHWYLSTKLHGITSQKAIVSLLTAMRMSSLTPSLPFIPQSIYLPSNGNLYLGDTHFKSWPGYLLPWLQFSWICSALLVESHNSTS
jgi:hypothetical protein